MKSIHLNEEREIERWEPISRRFFSSLRYQLAKIRGFNCCKGQVSRAAVRRIDQRDDFICCKCKAAGNYLLDKISNVVRKIGASSFYRVLHRKRGKTGRKEMAFRGSARNYTKIQQRLDNGRNGSI